MHKLHVGFDPCLLCFPGIIWLVGCCPILLLWTLLSRLSVQHFSAIKFYDMYINISYSLCESSIHFLIDLVLVFFLFIFFLTQLHCSSFFSNRVITLWIKLPWQENPAVCDIRYLLTAVSTLWGLISIVYRDLPHWRWNQRQLNAEPKLHHWTSCSHCTQAMPN